LEGRVIKEYYDFLKEELDNFEGNFDKFILYIPEFFKLLCSLLDDEIINFEDRRKINSALAYFVVPNDVIPENIYGPMGYVDDIFACCVVLKHLKKKYGLSLLNKYWDNDENFETVLKTCYDQSIKLLEEQDLVEKVLKNSSLKLDVVKSKKRIEDY